MTDRTVFPVGRTATSGTRPISELVATRARMHPAALPGLAGGQPAHVRAWLEGSSVRGQSRPQRAAARRRRRAGRRAPAAERTRRAVGLRGAARASAGRGLAAGAGRRRSRSRRGGARLGARELPVRPLPQEARPSRVRLVVAADPEIERANAMAEAIFLARDLINTPAADLGPAELADGRCGGGDAFWRRMSPRSKATALLDQNYPAVYAVGQASARPPRVIDLTWGEAGAPQADAGRQGRVLRYRRPRPQDLPAACS